VAPPPAATGPLTRRQRRRLVPDEGAVVDEFADGGCQRSSTTSPSSGSGSPTSARAGGGGGGGGHSGALRLPPRRRARRRPERGGSARDQLGQAIRAHARVAAHGHDGDGDGDGESSRRRRRLRRRRPRRERMPRRLVNEQRRLGLHALAGFPGKGGGGGRRRPVAAPPLPRRRRPCGRRSAGPRASTEQTSRRQNALTQALAGRRAPWGPRGLTETQNRRRPRGGPRHTPGSKAAGWNWCRPARRESHRVRGGRPCSVRRLQSPAPCAALATGRTLCWCARWDLPPPAAVGGWFPRAPMGSWSLTRAHCAGACWPLGDARGMTIPHPVAPGPDWAPQLQPSTVILI